MVAEGFEKPRHSGQCEYTKPHPQHHRWLDGKVEPGNYRLCPGLKDPDPPDGFDYDTHTSHPQFSKQALGEFELWLRAGNVANPLGKMHLHFLYLRGHWEWVVRVGGHSPLCKTPRCRLVTIKEVNSAPK